MPRDLSTDSSLSQSPNIWVAAQHKNISFCIITVSQCIPILRHPSRRLDWEEEDTHFRHRTLSAAEAKPPRSIQESGWKAFLSKGICASCIYLSRGRHRISTESIFELQSFIDICGALHSILVGFLLSFLSSLCSHSSHALDHTQDPSQESNKPPIDNLSVFAFPSSCSLNFDSFYATQLPTVCVAGVRITW